MHHSTSENATLFGDRQGNHRPSHLSRRRFRPPTARHVALRPFCALLASGLAPDSSRAQQPPASHAFSACRLPVCLSDGSFSRFFLEARPCHFSSRPLDQNLLDILFGVRPPMHLVPRLQQYPSGRGATSSPLLSQCGRLKQLSLRQPVSPSRTRPAPLALPFRLMAGFGL